MLVNCVFLRSPTVLLRKYCIVLLTLFFSALTTLAQQGQSSPDPIRIEQPDGTALTIIGKGTYYIHRTETTDGYTVALNKAGVYEYAVLDESGDLVAGGIKARDPKKRKRKECRYLKAQTKHLSYTGTKLEALLLEIKTNTTTK